MGFVIATLILLAIVLAILTFPWWRPDRARDNPTLSGEDLAAELDEDVATGTLAAEDLEPAARDLEATKDDSLPAVERSGARRKWRWGLVSLLLVPLAAIVLYWHFGDWRFALEGERAAVVHRADTMLAQLRRHQRTHPDDAQGWIDLGRGSEMLGRYAQAARAFGHAVKLKAKPDADLLASWGEAQLLADPQNLTTQEQSIFKRVLKLAPNNARGLWYGGLLALKAGNRTQAIADWQRLLQQPDVPPQIGNLIRKHLSMLGASAASTAQPAKAASAGGDRVKSLAVTVELSPTLKSRVKQGETLYVFVRGAHGGPPLAVRKLKVGNFPVQLTFSDSDAMVQGHDLSSASGALDIVAHVSSSGDVAPSPGDLLGSRKVEPDSGHPTATVVIDQRFGQGGSQ